MSIVAIVLAADRGEGFPTARYTSPIRGVPMLDLVVGEAESWPVDEVIVVLGADADGVESGCDLSQVSVLTDPEWEEGAASPLRAVLDLVSRDRGVTHCVLARGDQPGVTADVVSTLIDRARDVRADAVVPKYRYATGWPVVIARPMWDVFLGMEGAIDVHDVVATHAASVDEVWFDQLSPTAYARHEDLPVPRR